MLSYRRNIVEDYGQGRGISYGSLYNYDVRVPLCFYGPQFPAGVFESPVQSCGRGAHPGARHGGGPPSSSVGTGARRGIRRNDAGPGDDALRHRACAIPCWRRSGTFAYGVEFEKLVDLNALGGFVVKGLSREPIEGNPPPRVYESEAGMINSIGLQNIGVRAFVREKLPALARLRTAVFANVFGYEVEDYVEVVRVLNDHEGLAGYELNVSCPNTAHGGIYFSSDPELLSEVVSAAKRVARASADRQALAQRQRHRAAGARRGRERRRCHLAGQYLHQPGDRRPHPPAAHRRRLRRPFRSRHQAHRAAPGLPGRARREDSGDRPGRHRQRRRCRRIPDRRSQPRWKWAPRRSGIRAPPCASPQSSESSCGKKKSATSRS